MAPRGILPRSVREHYHRARRADPPDADQGRWAPPAAPPEVAPEPVAAPRTAPTPQPLGDAPDAVGPRAAVDSAPGPARSEPATEPQPEPPAEPQPGPAAEPQPEPAAQDLIAVGDQRAGGRSSAPPPPAAAAPPSAGSPAIADTPPPPPAWVASPPDATAVSARPAGRRPRRLLVAAAAVLTLAVAAVVAAIAFGGDDERRAQAPAPRSTARPAETAAPKRRAASSTAAGGGEPSSGRGPVRLRSAADFDPFGDDGEHPELAALAVDGVPGTTWSTEEYDALGKPGVGLMVAAGRPVEGRSLRLSTPTPGFRFVVYGVGGKAPRRLEDWTKLARSRTAGRDETVRLDAAGEGFRRYLLWITSLPPAAKSAKIGEVTLRR